MGGGVSGGGGVLGGAVCSGKGHAKVGKSVCEECRLGNKQGWLSAFERRPDASVWIGRPDASSSILLNMYILAFNHVCICTPGKHVCSMSAYSFHHVSIDT